MSYIYNGHMGDLFVSDHELSFDERYCEQCGDSDSFLGEANTADEAWDLLEPCTVTHHCMDSDKDCDECEFAEKCFGYNYGYVAKFIYEEFTNTIKNPIKIVLLMTHPDYPDRVYAEFKKNKDGVVYPELPFTYTLDEHITFHAHSLCLMTDKYVEESFQYLDTRIIDGVKYIYFVAKAEDDVDKCHYYDGSWVGFANISGLSELDKCHFNVIAEKAQIDKFVKDILAKEQMLNIWDIKVENIKIKSQDTIFADLSYKWRLGPEVKDVCLKDTIFIIKDGIWTSPSLWFE